MIRNTLNYWSDSHIFYGQFDNSPKKEFCKELKDEYLWRDRMAVEGLNGSLIKNNSFFNSLKNNNKQYLAHITYGLDDILSSRSLFASGGCLVGSIYSTPLTQDDDRFRLHNLGDYIFEKEASILGQKKNGKVPDILIFEIDETPSWNTHLIGIDYLGLGEIHTLIYKDLEYLLSVQERFNLQETINKRVKKSMDFLGLCSSMYYGNYNVSPEVFIQCYLQTIPNLTILGYIYFEVISEYIMLFQDSKISQIYKDLGELYSPSYKNLMYELQPGLKDNFKLSSFSPSIESIFDYLTKKQIIKYLNYNQFSKYIADRLLILTMSRLLKNTEDIEWKDFEWSFNNLLGSTSSLVGHLIHRELRNFGRYPSLYFYFDQTKALQIWNYWNHMDIVIPFNGILPKGEIGINPAYPDLQYKVYLGKVSNEKEFSYVEPVKELDISIEPRLVELRYTTMRNKTEQVNLKV